MGLETPEWGPIFLSICMSGYCWGWKTENNPLSYDHKGHLDHESSYLKKKTNFILLIGFNSFPYNDDFDTFPSTLIDRFWQVLLKVVLVHRKADITLINF